MAFVNNAAKPYGDEALAAVGIILRVFMIALFIIFGYNQGFQPLAGYSWGAKNKERLLEAIKVSAKWLTVYSVITTAIYMIFARQIIQIFSDDINVINIGASGLRIYSIMLPFIGAAVLMNILFQATGKGLQAAVLSVSRQGIFLLPAILILPGLLGLDGVFFSQAVADFFTMVLTGILSVKMIKEIKKM